MIEKVQLLTELTWNFRDSPTGGYPIVWPKTDFGHTSAVMVDPFPAYHHDLDVVREALEIVSEAFPLPEPFSPVLFVLDREVLTRMNGAAGADFDYDWTEPEDDPKDDKNQRPWRGHITLSGKRIPPHPGMTRYLVGHEYGHVVEDWLIRKRHERAYSHDLLHEYADLRGISPTDLNVGASGGRWHDAIQEIFACDFRLIVAEVETEFWPHPGVPRPEGLAPVVEFWKTARRAK